MILNLDPELEAALSEQANREGIASRFERFCAHQPTMSDSNFASRLLGDDNAQNHSSFPIWFCSRNSASNSSSGT